MTTPGDTALPSIPTPELESPLPEIVTVEGARPSGQAQASIDLLVRHGRGGIAPNLSLTYRSGAGNGVFGIGWSLELPTITRSGDQRLPRYRDGGADRDLFVSSEAGELVPVLVRSRNRWEPPRPRRIDGLDVTYYRARDEKEFIRVERHTDPTNGRSHWVTRSPDNLTRVYGRSDQARVFDPRDPRRVAQWLLEELRDPYGNLIAYRYKPEDLAGVSQQQRSELRWHGEPGAARHPKRVLWGNAAPGRPGDWHFELVFDYGEHDHAEPTPDDSRGAWTLRADPHSSYRSGFEVRTRRLCRRVLLFHHFQELGPQPCLVRAHELSYRERATGSQLSAVTLRGYRRERPGGLVRDQPLAPVEFAYTEAGPPGPVRELSAGAMLGGAPSSLVAQQWIDLEGEGLVGLLSYDGRALRYKQNLGEGRFGAPAALAQRPAVTDRPGLAPSVDQPFANGHSCLLDLADTPAFQQRNGRGTWEPYTPFPSAPTAQLNDAANRNLDLDGDGRGELMLADEHGVHWHQFSGPEGWAAAERVHHDTDAPSAINDRIGSVLMADMTGDGLADLVRVRPGSVSYWPNLGYGRFGERIDMAGAPALDGPDGFDPARVRLADIDGSGSSDLLYLGRRGVSWHPNQCGNGFEAAREVPGLPPITALDSVAVVDLLGTGTGCLVWSSSAPAHQERPLRYLQLTNGSAPHLLRVVRNNRGAETTLSYTPSTQLMLEDRAQGHPWHTTLPFPAQVLTELRETDHITGGGRVSSWRYRHGHYDDRAREPRGFAYVERRDRQLLPADPAGQTPPPPVRETRSWYHTGAYLDGETLERRLRADFYSGDGAQLAPPLTVEDPDGLAPPRELKRALQGRLRREEVYGLGDDARSVHPHSVTEHGYLLRALQPAAASGKPAVAAFEQETITHLYEQAPDDPRVDHRLALRIDEGGTTLLAAEVAYGRRRGGEPEQRRALLTVTRREVANVLDQPDWYRVGVPIAEESFELTPVPRPAGGRFRVDELRRIVTDPALPEHPVDAPAPEDGPPRRRLLARGETRYWDEDLNGPAAGASPGPLALVYEQQRLALTHELLRSAYGDRIDPHMLEAAGYVRRGPEWWAPGERLFYDRQAFYQPVRSESPLGTGRSIAYDAHQLFVAREQLPDPIADEHRATYDYQALSPSTVTDPNGAQTHFAYDALGLISALAHTGRNGEGDTLATPTQTVTRDPLAWLQRQAPVETRTAARQRHADPNTAWERSVTYHDGAGRPIQQRVLAEPGPAAELTATGELRRGPDGRPVTVESAPASRWVTTRHAILAGADQAVREYLPYATTGDGYVAERDAAALAPASRTQLDALGRAVQVDLPDGTVRRSVHAAWRREEWDQNDTVVEREQDGAVRVSGWYRARTAPQAAAQDRAAARAAAEHSETPTITQLDPAGRAFLRIDDNGAAGRLSTRSTLDVRGALRAIRDARGVLAERRIHDHLEQTIATHSADAGETRVLHDVDGRPSLIWGALGQLQRLRYDRAGRLTHREMRRGDGPWRLVEWRLYGNDLADGVPYARGRVHLLFDGAGQLRLENDFRGNPVLTERTLRAEIFDPARGRELPVDWSALVRANSRADLDRLAGPLLGERLPTSVGYDAMGRPLRRSAPDGTVTETVLGPRGLPATASATVEGVRQAVLAAAIYDEAGRRTSAQFGNGVRETMAYDRNSGQLRQLRTTLADGSALRDQTFTRDAVGNVVHVADAAQQARFFDNAMVPSERTFGYDALYRLTSATGREAALPPPQPNRASEPPIWPLPPRNDPTAARPYTERFEYDAGGNLTFLEHVAPVRNGSWSVGYAIAPDSNRVVGLHDREGRLLRGRFGYDPAGNSRALGALIGFHWDDEQRLVRVELEGGGTAYHAYDADGQRVHSVVRRLGGMTEERVRLGGWDRWRQLTSAGDVVAEVATLHIVDGNQRIAVHETRRPRAAPVASRIWRYQHDDPVGTVTLETDADGDVMTFEEHRPYGGSAYRAAVPTAPPKRYRFRGAERDDDTGLDLHGVRSYAPWLCRWISPDPGGMLDGPNRYWYVRSNPVGFRDPSGFQSLPSESSVRGPLESLGPQFRVERLGPTVRFGWSYDIDTDNGGGAVPERPPPPRRDPLPPHIRRRLASVPQSGGEADPPPSTAASRIQAGPSASAPVAPSEPPPPASTPQPHARSDRPPGHTGFPLLAFAFGFSRAVGPYVRTPTTGDPVRDLAARTGTRAVTGIGSSTFYMGAAAVAAVAAGEVIGGVGAAAGPAAVAAVVVGVRAAGPTAMRMTAGVVARYPRGTQFAADWVAGEIGSLPVQVGGGATAVGVVAAAGRAGGGSSGQQIQPTATSALRHVASAVRRGVSAVRRSFPTVRSANVRVRQVSSRTSPMSGPRPPGIERAQPWAFGLVSAQERARAMVNEAARHLPRDIPLASLVDDVRFGSQSRFVVENGLRVIYIGPAAFRRSRIGQILEASHELVHAEQFRRFVARISRSLSGISLQDAYRVWQAVIAAGARAGHPPLGEVEAGPVYVFNELVAERLARWRVARGLNLPDLDAGTVDYIRRWLAAFPGVATQTGRIPR